MAYYVYILQSEKDNSFYKGFTENPIKRLEQHNSGEMNYTSKKIPWQIVGLFQYETKKEALIAEKKLKKYDRLRLNVFIKSNNNKCESFKELVG